MEKKLKIGIIGLGWLGMPLAQQLMEKQYAVWGTKRSAIEKLDLSDSLSVVFWQREQGISQALKNHLQTTDILVLNLPPSVFLPGQYAEGLVNFINYISAHTRVVFTSSTSVYPASLTDAREDCILTNEGSQPVLQAENQLQAKLANRLCILRLAGLIGEDRHPVYYLAKKMVNENPLASVNLIHRVDVINVILTVIEQEKYGEIFNVCHPDHPTRQDYYTQKARTFNLPALHFNQSKEKFENKIVNCSKLRTKLKYIRFQDL